MSSRQSAVVSASESETARPPPTLTVRAAPAVRVRELAVDQLDEVVDVQQVADLLAEAAVADVARAAGRTGGRAASR